MVFGLGAVYEAIHTVISFRDPTVPPRTRILRLILASSTIVCLIVCIATAAVAGVQRGSIKLQEPGLWGSGVPGYVPHIVSTFAEWGMGVAFMMYFATFANDFAKIDVHVSLNLAMDTVGGEHSMLAYAQLM
jgi:hypothetical protein